MKTLGTTMESAKIRADGQSLAREIEGVVKTFDRVLQFKENLRISLLAKIDELKKSRRDHLNQIETLAGNITAYDENTDKTTRARKQLDAREKLIKENYEKMLAGALVPEELESPKTAQSRQGRDINAPTDKGASGHDTLIARRKKYLETLDNTFRKLEEDLFHIAAVRTNLADAQKAIDEKKAAALSTKATLENNSKSLAKKQEKLEEELNLSIQQENALLQEYRTIIKSAGSDIEISHETDELIFSLLAVIESAEKQGGDPESTEKFRPKVLEKTG